MNLFRATGTFFKWYGTALGTFARAKPLTTGMLVLCSALAKLAHISARILPIKVILLAGSEGVPSYFQPFLSPDQKDVGLAVLIAATLVCYFSDFALEAFAKKLSETGSRKVVESAHGVVLTSHRQEAQDAYATMTEIAAELVFAGLFFSIILRINAPLFLMLFTLFGVLFLVTAWLLRGNIYDHHRRSAILITDELGSYLDILSMTSFVASFVFILLPFALGINANILFAIISITFLRRALRSLTFSVRNAVKLKRRSHEVNPLIFADQRVQRRERPENVALREMFASRQRYKRTERELARIKGPVTSMRTKWIDPSGGVHRFSADVVFKSGESSLLVERVFPQSRISKLDSEEFLFRYLPREAILAPPVLTRFTAAPFECYINDLGRSVEPVAPAAWRQVHAEIVEALWRQSPPEGLVQAFFASHAQLFERLDPELVGRMSIAVSNEREEKLFADLMGELPRLREELRALPLFINNPDLGPHTTWQRENGELMVLDWSDWSIQPIGVGQLPMRGNPDAINAILERLRASRSDLPARLDASHVLRASECADLERALDRGMFRTALGITDVLLSGRGADVDGDTTDERLLESQPERQVA